MVGSCHMTSASRALRSEGHVITGNPSILILRLKVNSRLHSSFSRLHTSFSLPLIIFSCLYFLWIKAVPPITYLGLNAALPSPQSFQNRFRYTYRQVQLSHVTCQDLSHLINTLANTNGLLVSDLHHLTQ